ncbi:MAG TPA: IS1380 family transposase [Rickettsiales bacterium]|nr:IS1380 family transposase [Rickettsiales bacterium]
MKITYSGTTINAFGGINFADKIFSNASVYSFIDKELGSRRLGSEYSYSDLFRTYLLLVLCGGECAEDVTEHLKSELNQIRNFKTSSADTLLRMQKELAGDKQTYISDSKTKHEFSINMKMNKLMLKLLIHTGQINSKKKDYVLDYDNQFIPTDKYDAKRSYKKTDGYFPGIASINNMPIYIENRNGNSGVKFLQDETLERCFGLLKKQDIKIKHGRMDCGSFDKKVIAVLEKNTKFFYVRAQRCPNLYRVLTEITHWQTVEIGNKEYEIASIEYAPFGKTKTYRYVVSREKRSDGQYNLFTGDPFTYRAIITNNRKMTDLEVIKFYNARGESERLFDEMNNDFLWKKMPFSFLEQNTVFLIMMAICRNLIRYLIEFASKRLDFISPNFRLKKFIFRFIVLPSKWIKRGRQYILKLFSAKKYHLLLE